jgi:DNA-binding NarL/FixJ family response regulator
LLFVRARVLTCSNPNLRRREQEVRRAPPGEMNHEIAAELNQRVRAVKRHLGFACKKLGVSNQTEGGL